MDVQVIIQAGSKSHLGTNTCDAGALGAYNFEVGCFLQ